MMTLTRLTWTNRCGIDHFGIYTECMYIVHTVCVRGVPCFNCVFVQSNDYLVIFNLFDTILLLSTISTHSFRIIIAALHVHF